jgi:SAM-dependent methyltransferase
MFKNVDVKELDHCLACGSDRLVLTLDLGNQPLANSYKLNQNDVQQEFPLAINRCSNCYHVQLTHAVNPDLMYKDYLYVSGTSQTMNDHFAWFAKYTSEYFDTIANRSARTVLDIGCNDGSQLDKFKELDVETFGVDPAENLYTTSVKNHNVVCGYFDLDFVQNYNRQYDIIVAQNVFAHNFDPTTFLNAARNVMTNDSLLFIQTSQADMIKNNEFDTIYHEHISFYNINSMNELCMRVGLNLIDVIKCPLHGNSYIFVISKYHYRGANVQNLIDMERKAGLLTDQTYIDYAIKCEIVVEKLRSAVRMASGHNYKIVGYGAAAKGMTLLNYSGIKLDYIIDDNPLKQGRYTPGSSIPIVSSDTLKTDDATGIMFIPLAWNFFDEIKNRIKNIRNNHGDRFLRYFPTVENVDA